MPLRPFLLLALAAVAAGGCGGGLPHVVAEADAPPQRLAVRGRVVTSYGARPARGAYGLRLRLVLRRRDGAWVVPEGRGRHRQWDVADESGAYRFELAPRLDLSAFDSVAVVPTAANATVSLVPLPRGAARLGDDVGLWADALRAPLGDGVVADLSGRLRPEVGVTVRTATLAREFVEARYGGAVPFELPPVRVELSRGGGYVFQALDPDVLALGGHEIELNTSRALTPTTVAHEYGHYVSFRMWGANPLRYTLRNRSLREGWAIFFSFAVRAYAAATYGDVDLEPSNPERAPFTDRLDGRERRYLGISYGTSRPEYAAIGALLWSLYDGAEPSPFEWEGPDEVSLAGDNDDLGLGLEVLEAVRRTRTSALDEAGILEVVGTLRRARPALGPSLDGAVGFFLCPAHPACDYPAPPSAAPSTSSPTLRPVAPGGLEARRLPSGAVGLRWSPRTTRAPWANRPEAYRVYRDGALAATLPPEVTGWLDEAAGPGALTYEVRAVGGGGESAESPTARVPAVGGR